MLKDDRNAVKASKNRPKNDRNAVKVNDFLPHLNLSLRRGAKKPSGKTNF